jgi:hypothetical protein
MRRVSAGRPASASYFQLKVIQTEVLTDTSCCVFLPWRQRLVREILVIDIDNFEHAVFARVPRIHRLELVSRYDPDQIRKVNRARNTPFADVDVDVFLTAVFADCVCQPESAILEVLCEEFSTAAVLDGGFSNPVADNKPVSSPLFSR